MPPMACREDALDPFGGRGRKKVAWLDDANPHDDQSAIHVRYRGMRG